MDDLRKVLAWLFILFAIGAFLFGPPLTSGYDLASLFVEVVVFGTIAWLLWPKAKGAREEEEAAG